MLIGISLKTIWEMIVKYNISFENEGLFYLIKYIQAVIVFGFFTLNRLTGFRMTTIIAAIQFGK